MHGQKRSPRRAGKFKASMISGVMVIAGLGTWAAEAHSQTDSKEAAAKRGRAQFAQSCAFCHGLDATGGRGPDLIRSALVAHDQKGELISEVIRNGRPDKGMPAIPSTDEQVADIAAFLHARALQALNSSGVPRDYPVEKLLTGNAEAGKSFFEGAGGCKNCHSTTGDLAGVARKYPPVELEAHMLYPGEKPKSAVITLASGEQVRGTVVRDDDFMIGVRDPSGWYRSFSRDKVKAEIHDPLETHRKLLDTLSTSQVHDLFAFVNSLK